MDTNDGAASLVRSDALLACPFCGGVAELASSGYWWFREWCVACTQCGAMTAGYADAYLWKISRQDAIDTWNRRNANAPQQGRRSRTLPADVGNPDPVCADCGRDLPADGYCICASHAHDCAVAINARHGCSCGANAPREAGAVAPSLHADVGQEVTK